MINSVSFAARKELYEKPNMDAPQAHQRPDANQTTTNQPKVEKKSNHKVAKTIAGIVATAAILAGAVVAGSKFGWFKPETLKKIMPKKILDLNMITQNKDVLKNGLAAIEKFGNTIADYATTKGTAVVDFFKNLVPKKTA